jgi:hypothetical protein
MSYEKRKRFRITYESKSKPWGEQLFFVAFYSEIAPTVVEPHSIFNKIRGAAVPQLWMILNEQLN